MLKDYPDYRDAELTIKVYELRREQVMRESRDKLATFWPRTFEDVSALIDRKHPLNAAYRQVGSYWELVYSMPKHRIVDPEFFIEANGEGLLLFAKVEPFLDQIRAATSPRAFANAEWVAKNTETGKSIFESMRARVKKTLESK